jgi:hypothetical protein
MMSRNPFFATISLVIVWLGLILNTTHAQLVNEADITTVHWDCGFNEGAGIAANDAGISCPPFGGGSGSPFGLAINSVTDGAGNIRITNPMCGSPSVSQMRTTDYVNWGGIPQSTSEITVFEINFTYETGGALNTNDWPFGAFYLHDNDYPGNPDLQTHAWWLGNGENPAWSSGTSDGNDASNILVTGHWIFVKGEESPGVFVEGQHCGLRMILDPNTDGPAGVGSMLIRYEYNVDVLGAGAWTEFTPTGVDADTMRSQSRTPTPTFGNIGVWIFNTACDGTALLVDRTRVYEVSSIGSMTPVNPVNPDKWSIFE